MNILSDLFSIHLLAMTTLTKIILIAIGLFVIISFLVILFHSHNKKQNPSKIPVIDQSSIDEIINYLGGINNIISASIDGARISIKVKSSSLCQLDKIKAIGALGIFVTGTTIKMMLPYDSQNLIHQINHMIKGEN